MQAELAPRQIRPVSTRVGRACRKSELEGVLRAPYSVVPKMCSLVPKGFPPPFCLRRSSTRIYSVSLLLSLAKNATQYLPPPQICH